MSNVTASSPICAMSANIIRTVFFSAENVVVLSWSNCSFGILLSPLLAHINFSFNISPPPLRVYFYAKVIGTEDNLAGTC